MKPTFATPYGHTGRSHEENIPTEQPPPQAYARFSRAHAHEERTPGPEGAPREGACPSLGLSPRAGRHGVAAAGDLRVRDCRFTRRDRLLRREDFARVFERQRSLRHEGWVTLVCANDLGHPRLGIAVPRRAVPGAVARNRFKRLVREYFRLNRRRLGGRDIVVLARRDAARLSARALRNGLEKDWTAIERCKDC